MKFQAELCENFRQRWIEWAAKDEDREIDDIEEEYSNKPFDDWCERLDGQAVIIEQDRGEDYGFCIAIVVSETCGPPTIEDKRDHPDIHAYAIGEVLWND